MSTTYVVELTPVGRGAVAVVLVAGPNAVRAVSNHFVPAGKRSIPERPIGRILFGRWGSSGEELIVCRRAEDQVEIHCHGGVAAVRAVMDSLCTEGYTEISWREWLSRDQVSPRLEVASRRDATTCEAQIALADAVTMRTASILVDQMNGALSAAIREILSAVSAENWPPAAALLSNLMERRDVGLHLTTPWRVVLAGPPNVGKSSLINALAGYERAIVSPIPGTTRDVVTLNTAIDGWPVVLADTAGLRASNDELESAGVELAQSALAGADLAILVRDATSSAVDSTPWKSLPSRTIEVRNKIDLLPAGVGVEDGPARGSAIPVSALTGEGIANLAVAIGMALVPHPPAVGAAVPFTPAQFEKLAVARDAVEQRRGSPTAQALQSLLAVAEGSGFGVQE
jgi:tRNA modification GTPase